MLMRSKSRIHTLAADYLTESLTFTTVASHIAVMAAKNVLRRAMLYGMITCIERPMPLTMF